uniref:cDNA FLJ10043 fis, clone HEMBA1001085 n=1 Tax=Homo sapiens TaxID=9606 RepID=Q9NWG3_HUMAN|nr:unnamed protein product [Homo sapiens]
MSCSNVETTGAPWRPTLRPWVWTRRPRTRPFCTGTGPPATSSWKITTKQKQRHPKVGEWWALVWSCRASVVGKDSGTAAPSHSPPLAPETHLPSFFPTASGLSFSAATLTFSEAEAPSPTFVPPTFFWPFLEIFPYCSCLETVASWVLTALLFVLSH